MNKLPSKMRGAVMVELVLITFLLLFLVFGITELGRALYQQNTLTKAVESGTRYLARAYDALTPSNICSERAAWDAAEEKAINLVVYGNEQGVGDPLLLNLDAPGAVVVDPNHRPDDLGAFAGICVIRMSATASFDSLVLSALGLEDESGDPLLDITLEARSQERWIGE